jgi:hypothetical protein
MLLKAILKIMSCFLLDVYPMDVYLCVMRLLVLCGHHHHKAVLRTGFLIGGGVIQGLMFFLHSVSACFFAGSLKFRCW